MKSVLLLLLGAASVVVAGPFAPPAGQPGSDAVAFDDPRIVGWATGVSELMRGPQDISTVGSPLASYGTAANAVGAVAPSGDPLLDSLSVVSLGDGGSITLTFANPITNGAGADFAVFENGLNDSFLELAFVEVSSNGIDFFRFDAVSKTQVGTQVEGFGSLDATNLSNLAGKYRVGFGTPFDLQELAGTPGLNILAVTHVRVTDVIGNVDPAFPRSFDSQGNVINDPFSTPFETGGFDLDGVAVLNAIPEPSVVLLLLMGAVPLCKSFGKRLKIKG